MTATWYFYYQLAGCDIWRPALATARAQTLHDKKPRYMTVLDVNTNITHDTERADLDKLAYRGDLYVDIDVSVEMGGIETAIVQINTLIDKFSKLGVNPETLRIFASGSKGFHLEIPRETFLDKEPKVGIPHLPIIYKEIVHTPELYVDGIDNRVYSTGRGRQWRSLNVERENGKFKVQISLEECRDLTPEIYAEMVSRPRAIPLVQQPTYCPELAVMYATAHDQVLNRRKRIVKSKVDPAQMARWAKKPPTELQHLLAGNSIKDGAGFHPIAIQVALAATTLGWSVDEMIERAQGLIENHRGDGNRYDSPGKRRRELVRLWYYYQGGSGSYYEFALTPIRSLLDVQAAAPVDDYDMDMPAAEAEAEEEELHDIVLTAGVKVRRTGIFKTVEGNEVKASAIGFGDITQLYDSENNETLGYQADMFLDGRKLGNRLMTLNLFSSRQNFQGFALANGGASVHLSDAQVVGMAELFRNKSMKTDNRIYLVSREGMDYIRQQNGKVHAIYVSHDNFYCNPGDDTPRRYALKSVGRDAQPIESDILDAEEVSGTQEELEFIRHLLKSNKTDIVARLLGWFTAAFISQAIRLWKNQFPLLHIYGTAGAGKTKTVELYSNLHFHYRKPEIEAAASLTNFAMKTRLAASASIPVIWDEVKFHEMALHQKNNITQYLRNNYAAVKTSAGTLRKETGQTHVDLREYRNSAPLVFIGETMETETAIAERYVAVALTKQDRAHTTESFEHCHERRHLLGRIGKSLIQSAMNLDRDEMGKTIKEYEKVVGKSINGSSSDDSRRIFNYAVTLYGLDFFRDTIEPAFPGEFGETLEDMKKALLSTIRGDLPTNMSEASKVLDTFAYLSKTETAEQYRLTFGQDYTTTADTVDIKLRTCFTKYQQYCRSVGNAPLFPSYEKFVAGMRKYPATMDEHCLDNDTLKDTLRVDVFRFSAKVLHQEGLDLFRGQDGALK